MVSVGLRALGIILFVYPLLPIGDMLTVLAAKGSAWHVFESHGVTALVMAPS